MSETEGKSVEVPTVRLVKSEVGLELPEASEPSLLMQKYDCVFLATCFNGWS